MHYQPDFSMKNSRSHTNPSHAFITSRLRRSFQLSTLVFPGSWRSVHAFPLRNFESDFARLLEQIFLRYL
jgi:hypothetical protein